MSSNDVLPTTDTRRLSPQTISSSGYHSDLSSTNQSPQSIHENPPLEPSANLSTEKKDNKNFARLSSFLRKQYEKAKIKFASSKQRPSPSVTTCCKATSTTALSQNHPTKAQQLPLPSIDKRSSFIEPVQSIYVPAIHSKQTKMLPEKQDYYPRQSSRRFTSYSQTNNSQVHSHSYRRLIALSNYENISPGYSINHSSGKPRYSQDYYPYKYLNKNYHANRPIYVPLSDFISTTNSAFKPIKSSQHTVCNLSEQITPSDDPCDLEVAQYFHQPSQWSNPNYFDIYQKEMSLVSTRTNYTETLC